MRAICIEGLLCDHKQVQLDVLNLHSSWAAWSFLKFVRVHRPYVKRLYYGRNRSSHRYFRLSELCKANVFVFLKSDWKFFPKEKKSIQTDNALVLTQTEGSADSVIREQSSQHPPSRDKTHYFYDMLRLHLLREKERVPHVPSCWAVLAYQSDCTHNEELSIK